MKCAKHTFTDTGQQHRVTHRHEEQRDQRGPRAVDLVVTESAPRQSYGQSQW